MTRISKIAKSPPAAIEDGLNRLGRNIRIARLQRRLSKEELAERNHIKKGRKGPKNKGVANTKTASP